MGYLQKKAIEFAVRLHAGQTRKEGSLPYIVHPFEVMKKVQAWGFHDENMLAAAILHDVCEDCDVSAEEIEKEFNVDIASIVADLTKPEGANKQEYIDNFHTKCLEAIFIKAADRIANTYDFMATDLRYAKKYLNKGKPIFLAIFEAIRRHSTFPISAPLRDYHSLLLSIDSNTTQDYHIFITSLAQEAMEGHYGKD